MAQRIQHYPITADANTPPANYEVIAVSFTPGQIVAIDVHFPSGHRGQTGFQLSYGDAQVIPAPPQLYLRGNKTVYHFAFDDPFPGGSGWYAQVYNTGRYPHTFELSVELDEVSTTTPQLPPVILLPVYGEPGGAASAPAPGLPLVTGGGPLVE